MRILTLLLLIVCFFPVDLNAGVLPEWLVPLRDAVYEQRLTADQIRPLYLAAKASAAQNRSGAALDLALSRCEYFMGRALQDGNRNEEARPHYLEGIRLAEKVTETSPDALAWLSLAQNLSQACSLGPWTYTVANGLNVEKFAKNALSFDRRNAPAQYLIAARWVYAPAPFNNLRKGIEMMNAIIENGDMEKDDFFNVYSAIGYAYIQQKRNADARPWLLRALEFYPTNKYVRELLNEN